MMDNKAKMSILQVIIIIVILICAYSTFFKASDSIVKIDYTLGISGKIDAINRARGYKIYFQSSKIPYSLNSFNNDSISKSESLGSYVEIGDTIEKKTNSDTLILTRKGKRTVWLYFIDK